jgi:hypothetical protein
MRTLLSVGIHDRDRPSGAGWRQPERLVWRGLAGHLLNLDDAPAEDNLVGDALPHNRWELHPADYLALVTRSHIDGVHIQGRSF